MEGSLILGRKDGVFDGFECVGREVGAREGDIMGRKDGVFDGVEWVGEDVGVREGAVTNASSIGKPGRTSTSETK